MPDWHGQQLEDQLLWYLLSPGTGEKFTGTFVDVGAHDGIEFSNTLVFEQAGWSGLCIEPNPYSFGRMTANRPDSYWMCAAIGDRDQDDVDFFITNTGLMSSSRADYRDESVGYYGQTAFEGWRKIQVPMFRLDTLLSSFRERFDFGIPRIDVVSIDVEGSENEVLAGFHPKDWSVRIVVIEIQLDKDIPTIKEWFGNQGYTHIAKLSSNHFFSSYADDIHLVEQWSPS